MSFRVKDRKWKPKRKYIVCEARMLYDCWHEENQRHQRFKDKLQPQQDYGEDMNLPSL